MTASDDGRSEITPRTVLDIHGPNQPARQGLFACLRSIGLEPIESVVDAQAPAPRNRLTQHDRDARPAAHRGLLPHRWLVLSQLNPGGPAQKLFEHHP